MRLVERGSARKELPMMKRLARTRLRISAETPTSSGDLVGTAVAPRVRARLAADLLTDQIGFAANALR